MGPVVRLEGLPFRVSKEELKEFFSACQLAHGIDSIHLIMNNEGRASGLGYVELAADEDVAPATKLNEQNIAHHNRYAKICQCEPEELKWYLNRKNAADTKKYRVIMSGLPFRASEYDIASWFGEEAACCDVEIHLNRDGRPSGEATAFFDNEEQVEKAMEKDKEDMNGRYINLTKESSGPKMRTGFFVRMSGLPYRATEQEIKDFFSDVADCIGVRVIFNREGRPSGEAVAEFETEADAEAAMKKNRQHIGSRFVILSREGGRSQDSKNGAGAVGEFAIRMGGLPFKSSVEDIKDWFKPVAECVHARLLLNREGRPSGEARAEFETKEEAEKAMGKNKDYMGERFVILTPLY